MLTKKTIALTSLLALGFGFLGGALGAGTVNYFDQAANANHPDDNVMVNSKVVEESSQMIDAIATVRPAVVSIVATKDLQIAQQNPFDLFFGSPFEEREVETLRQQVSGGSGFIVSEDGLVVTNKHVVKDTEADYAVIMNDGREFKAQVISRDPVNDLAVVQILEDNDKKPSELVTVELGDSDSLQVGQRVIAIGNALGEFQNTVTSGIVSAVSRQIEAGDQFGRNRDVLTNLIQTDAPINQGNSGGPLINLEGQVVAVNTAVATGNSLGFAIPIGDVAPVIDSVIEFGKIVRPQLGVRYVILNEVGAEELNLGVSYGALLSGNVANGEFAVIPDSAADKAGLKSEDVILEVDNQKIDQSFGLRDAIRNKKPGDKVELKVWRDGEELNLEVELDEFKN